MGVDRLDSLPRALTLQEEEVRDASNAFAFDLLRTSVADDDPGTNVVVSPLSVSMALGMAANGAAGSTLDSIQQSLAEQLCRDESVEATVIGKFEATGQLKLTFDGQQVGCLEMSFLHDGRPAVVRKAT